ncbi:hypothetical protein [Bacillus cereus]|uniref:hypothetical protein n=1 Tax=Bacillus cereus TaxID=1396 RepID=UPI000BFDDA39|nr:hypothetical protein [Bacillus cereus]PGY12026.1 hypothetical protein COE23_18760 [Bacillus cereus]
MGILDLKQSLLENSPLYYENKRIKVIEIYDLFNLVDVIYENEEIIFTIDLMSIIKQPNQDIYINLNKIGMRG